jgi:hypothetical protein
LLVFCIERIHPIKNMPVGDLRNNWQVSNLLLSNVWKRRVLSMKMTKSLFQTCNRSLTDFQGSLHATCGDMTKSNLRLVIGATMTFKVLDM